MKSETAGEGSTAPFTGGWVHGTILGIEPERDVLFIRARETKRTLSIRWVPETQFTIEGRPSSSAELRPGQSVRIHCRVGHHELEADSISAAAGEKHGSEEAKVIQLWVDPNRASRAGASQTRVSATVSRHSSWYGRQEKHPDR